MSTQQHWRTPHATCRYCHKPVRLRRDGSLAKHLGVNRKGVPGWRCIGSRLQIRPANVR